MPLTKCGPESGHNITKYMNTFFKKIAAVGVGVTLTVSAFGQVSGAAPAWQFTPLLSGYNLLVQSNLLGSTGLAYSGTNAGATLGTTNVQYTTYNGQVVLSYNMITNNAGSANTNLSAPDAFKTVELTPDANGDINRNASLIVMWGNTNYIPQVSLVSTNPTVFASTNWALAVSQYPNWLSPATTNTYPKFDTAQTNTVFVLLFRSPSLKTQGGVGPDLQPAIPMWESTSSFMASFTTATGNTPGCMITNLPAEWLIGAKHVYANVWLPANLTTNLASGGVLINQLGILAPRQ
jgi:hypothetical protein